MTPTIARRTIAAVAIAAAAAAIAIPVVAAAPAAAAVTQAYLAAGDRPGTGVILQSKGLTQIGTPATFTASLFPLAPVAGEPNATGTVSFFDGSRLLGTAALLSNDTASFSTSGLSAGLHTITASYNGDAVYAGSTSAPLTQEVTAATFFTNSNKVSGVVGAPLSFAVTSTGFPAPLLKAAGKLDGLAFTDHGDGTGTLAGTPVAAGTFAFSVSGGTLFSVTTQFLSLTVTPSPLSVVTASLPPAFTGQAYSTTLGAQGGTPPYTWTLAGGHLPKGITLNKTTGALSGTPTAAGTAYFKVRVTDSSVPKRHVAIRALHLTSTGIVPVVYVANGANDSVTSYPLSSGNLAPSTRLAGLGQGLNAPGGLVLNAAGRLFVADSGADAITEYDRGTTGSTPPTATIAGPATRLAGPAGLTLDASGRLYVANRTSNSITVFAPDVSGNTGPLFTISGPDTALSSPAAVAVDAMGRLWVANAGTNSLTAYATGATGDAKPVARIAGPATGLNHPQGLAQDASGNLLAANTFGESVTAYAISFIGIATNPNVAPIRTLSGSSTGLSFPDGIDVDAGGHIYVANQFGNDITSYPATANGNVAPLTTIAGSNTGLAGPGAIALTPPLSVLTGSLPNARAGHGYHVVLQAAEGTSPYAWSLAHGWLPPGLWLGRAGIIAGTRRHGGHWALTVRVTDSAHPHTVATRSFTLTVAGR